MRQTKLSNQWMKKKKILHTLFICIFFATVWLLISNFVLYHAMPNKTPVDFNFVFEYGEGEKDKLDTKSGVFTKGIGLQTPIITELQLTKAEMNEIYSEMVKINIAGYSTHFGAFKSSKDTPFETYTIQIYYDGNLKKIAWRDSYDDKRKKAYDLRRVYQKIIDIIRNHEEYKLLPRRGA